jgi:hypothetical protein
VVRSSPLLLEQLPKQCKTARLTRSTPASLHNGASTWRMSNARIIPLSAKRDLSGASDGEVHDNFAISGRTDTPGCDMTQPDSRPREGRSQVSAVIRTLSFESRLPSPSSDNGRGTFAKIGCAQWPYALV